jgi:hypothetical protein
VELALELVHDEDSESFAIDVLGDDDEFTLLRLGYPLP